MYTGEEFDSFDRSRGNGSSDSLDDLLDEVSIFGNEWGSQAATTFNADDPDAFGNKLPRRKRKRFERYERRHNGYGEQSRKDDIRWSHVLNDARMFMCTLELPGYQRDRVMAILQDIDISSKKWGGRPYEFIILALCSLVADEQMSKRQNPDIDDRLFLRDEFREVMNSVNMSSRDLRRTRAAIRERTKYFGHDQ